MLFVHPDNSAIRGKSKMDEGICLSENGSTILDIVDKDGQFFQFIVISNGNGDLIFNYAKKSFSMLVRSERESEVLLKSIIENCDDDHLAYMIADLIERIYNRSKRYFDWGNNVILPCWKVEEKLHDHTYRFGEYLYSCRGDGRTYYVTTRILVNCENKEELAKLVKNLHRKIIA